MKKVEVKLKENSYEVLIQNGLLNSYHSITRKLNLTASGFLLIDAKVQKYHPEKINKFLKDLGVTKWQKKIISTEMNKSFFSLQKILERMIKLNVNRDNLFISVGGGITGDVGGFAAAIYSRGISHIQIPTTLLACVDSSVGGKTGINLAGIKNIVGVYHQPSVVLIDLEFLQTLEPSEILSGMGEIVKYALLSDDDFFNDVFNNLDLLYSLNSKIVSDLIERSVKFKAGVVAKDEKEILGIRKILNLGHTFGHAIEADQNYKIKHGQAVIVGIVCSLYLSLKLNLMNEETFNKCIGMFDWFRGKVVIKNYRINSMLSAMRKDKKNFEGKIKFVLLQDIGKTLVNVEADKKKIEDSIKAGIQFFE